jgi:hypothetical protein
LGVNEKLRLARAALQEIRAHLLDLPGGVDWDANVSNTSPDDMSAHIGGLCVQLADVDKRLVRIEP